MKAACLAGSNLREISLGLRCSIPSRCNSMIRPDRPWYSMPNSCADKGANLACGPGQYLADPGLHPLLLCVGQATSSTVVTEVRQAFDAPSWYSRYHVRIVSSSSSSTLATASQLIPSSSSTSALARRASRCGADPSRANSIRSCRDSLSRNPLRIMKPAESGENDSASGFFGYPRNLNITERTVEIFHRGQRVAAHVRRYGGPRHGTILDHMPSAHRRYAEWSPERFQRQARDIGPNTEAQQGFAH